MYKIADQKESVFVGSFFIFLAAIAYASMGALVKFGKKIPDEQLVFMRNFICLICLAPWLLIPPKSIKTQEIKTHTIRAIAGLLNMYCFFISIRYIILTDAMLLNNTMPLFLPLIQLVWHKEKFPLKLIPGLAIGFLGVLLILRPGAGIFNFASLLALASGFFMSISMAGIRELTKSEPIYKIMFYYFALSSLISAIPLVWSWKNPSLIAWTILLGVGVFAASYQFFLTKGYTYALASRISPVIYFAVIFSAILDWAFWGVVPFLSSFIGIVFVVIGAIVCMRIDVGKK